MNYIKQVLSCMVLVTSTIQAVLLTIPSVGPISHFAKRTNVAERKSSYPYISGDTFRSIADFVVDETRIPLNPDEVHEGDIIFLNPDYMQFFFSQVHPKITCHYILITHNSDEKIPGKYGSYLDDDKIVVWFGQNVSFVHPKLVPIPIGIANRYLPHGDIQILDDTISQEARTIVLYLNILTKTNIAERQPVYQLFKKQSFCTVSSGKPFPLYLKDLACSQFVLSPPGNGFDCHRTWEALYLGAFPVVKSSAMDSLYADLPVIIIKNWQEVTKEFLESQYAIMKSRQYNLEKLYMDYWIEIIRQVQDWVRTGRTFVYTNMHVE